MKTLELIRVAMSLDFGTTGVLKFEGVPFALTMERPWLNNQKGISCVPEGTWMNKRVTSPKFGDTFELVGVNGRDKILYHRGNIQDDSHGCIIIGEQFEVLDGKPAVLASSKGFGEFLYKLKSEIEFRIAIKNRWE